MHHVVDVVVYVVLFAECACEGQAGEMFGPVPVNRVKVKPNDEGRAQPDVGQHRHGDEDAFSVRVKSPKGDVRQEGKGEKHAAEETKDVSNIVNPRQEAAQEEEENDARQLEKGLPWVLQHLPTLKQLNKEASKKSELRACWSHLRRENVREDKSYISNHFTKQSKANSFQLTKNMKALLYVPTSPAQTKTDAPD